MHRHDNVRVLESADDLNEWKLAKSEQLPQPVALRQKRLNVHSPIEARVPQPRHHLPEQLRGETSLAQIAWRQTSRLEGAIEAKRLLT